MTLETDVRANLNPEAGEGPTAYCSPTDIGDAIMVVANALMAAGATGTSMLADLAVTTGKLADSAVTSAKIADGTIVDADISGSAAIDPAKVAGTAVVQARTISAGTALTGGGSLAADRTLGVVAGGIVTALLADSAVTSAKIADGTIVDADISGSAAIDVSKLSGAVASASVGNLFTSALAACEATTGFYPYAANVTLSTVADGDYGTNSVKATATAAGPVSTDFGVASYNNVGTQPVVAGATYTMLLSIKSADTLGVNLAAYFYTAGGVYLSSVNTALNPTASWQRRTITFTPPATAAFVGFRFSATATAGSQSYQFDRLSLHLGTGGDWQPPGNPITGTLSADAVPNSLFDANTILAATADNTPAALPVAASRIVGRKSTGDIAAMTAAEARAVLGLATTDSPVFAGGTIGVTSPQPTYGAELGDGVSLTQNLTGLTIGNTYHVTAIGGTLLTATIDGVSVPYILNQAHSFVATATSHTVTLTTGTATGISVKQLSGPVPMTNTVGAAYLRSRDGTNISASPTITSHSMLTSGAANAFFGYSGHVSLTSGSYNAGFGAVSQRILSSGHANSAFGYGTQYYLTTGSWNSNFGMYSGLNLTTGYGNSGSGYGSLYTVTSGFGNSGLGEFAGAAFTTGNYNTALGRRAGYSGTGAGLSGTVTIGVDSLGTSAQATADNDFILGIPTHNVKVAGSFTTQAGMTVKVTNKAVNYTLTASDYIVNATAAVTITLPTAASVAGKTYIVKNSVAVGGVVTVDTTSSQTIDGALTRPLNQRDSLTVVSDGTNWMVL